jgi:hypothetical protein
VAVAGQVLSWLKLELLPAFPMVVVMVLETEVVTRDEVVVTSKNKLSSTTTNNLSTSLIRSSKNSGLLPFLVLLATLDLVKEYLVLIARMVTILVDLVCNNIMLRRLLYQLEQQHRQTSL